MQVKPDAGPWLFDLIWIGAPLTVVGIVYALVFSKHLLPDRQGPMEQLENAREYAFEVRVHSSGPMVGKSISEVGLRKPKSAYVLEIERHGRLITAATHRTRCSRRTTG